MATNKFYIDKQPDEKQVYTIDFSKVDIFKASGVRLLSGVATAIDEDGSDCTSSILTGCSINTTTYKTLSFGIINGIDGKQYRIKVLASVNILHPDASNYVKLESDFLLKVREAY